jgi:hypothetical protein
MSMRGTLKTDQVSLGRLTIDWMKAQGLQVQVLAGLIDSSTGKTRGWMDGAGIIWSEKTGRALEALRQAIEEDLAREHFAGDVPTSTTDEPKGLSLPTGGLGEHVGTADEPPSV